MATPVGHGIVGLTVAHGVSGSSGGRTPALYLLAAFAAVAPDLDFLPGILRGDPNLYHQSVSHSLVAAVVFGAVVVAVTRLRGVAPRSAWTAAWVAGISYASHLLVDLLGRDTRPPVGQPLLWPLSGEHVAPVLPLLPSVRHGGTDDTLGGFLAGVFSWENVAALGVEAAVLLPPCVVVLWWVRRRPRSAGDGTG